MYLITHTIDGVEVYRKAMPMGSHEDLMEASECFHNIVHEATESHPFSRGDDEDEGVLIEQYVSDEVIDHHENNGEALRLQDDMGRTHAFQMKRERQER